jgi:hypothetical protein
MKEAEKALTPLAFIQEMLRSNVDQDSAVLTENFRSLPQSFQANARIEHQMGPRPLLATSFPIFYSLIFLLFVAIWTDLPITVAALSKA